MSDLLARLADANAALAGWTRKLNDPSKFQPIMKAEWDRASDKREALADKALKTDPVAYVRAYPSHAYACRHLLPSDMVARIEAAETDAEMIAAVAEPEAPRMVPQVAQQQQGRDLRRGMARCEYPGCWQIGIWSVQKGGGSGRWLARATGPGTIGDGSPMFFDTLGEAYAALTGEAMPGAPAMVPQPVQQQQARARAPKPPRGERRYVTVRDCETGEVHRVLTSVARVGVAVVIFTPSNRHREGALNGMLITHDDIRKAWVFNDAAEAQRLLSNNRALGERVIRAELVADPAPAMVPQPCQQPQARDAWHAKGILEPGCIPERKPRRLAKAQKRLFIVAMRDPAEALAFTVRATADCEASARVAACAARPGCIVERITDCGEQRQK